MSVLSLDADSLAPDKSTEKREESGFGIEKLDGAHAHALETRAVAYFREIARVGSIAGAAANLYVAPSAISRQITLLEADLGARVLDRGRHGATLTAAGEALLEHADQTAVGLELVRSRMLDARSQARGLVRIATVESATTVVLPNLMRRVREEYPQAEFRLEVLGSHAVAEQVADGEADLGVTFGPPARAGVQVLAHAPAPLGIVSRGSSRFAGSNPIALEAVDGASVVLPVSRFGIRQEIDRAAHEVGVAFHVVMEANSLAALCSLVALDDLVSFLPRMALGVTHATDTLSFRPVSNRRFESTELTAIAPSSVRGGVIVSAAREALVAQIGRFADED
ncbi:LysR family transcriptional regulator [Microbacterium sp. A204]|uniref:LysR family transcriptional regulator n=1 Tax=Microbacterium sp. A204 TaxID=3457321 RepID=UPI003FD0B887